MTTKENDLKNSGLSNVATRESLEDYVLSFGATASISLFSNSYFFFSIPSIKGIIGYRIENQCAIVMGDPLCGREDLFLLTQAFITHCQSNAMRVIFVSVSKHFMHIVHPCLCASALAVADDLLFNPQEDPKKGSKGRLLRSKVSQALRFGITIHEYRTPCDRVEKELDSVAKTWLEKRQGPQIFLAPIDLFSVRKGKRWLYATYQEKIVGVCLLQELQAKNGWLLQWILTTPQAPNGTSELLVDSALSILRAEGVRSISFGAVQKVELGQVTGLNPLSSVIAKFSYKAAKKLLPLEKRRVFWKKFSPYSEDLFLLFEKSTISFREIKAIMKSLNVSF